MITVIKRDGQPQDFNRDKIFTAISHAWKDVLSETNNEAIQEVVEHVITKIGTKTKVTVEEIQDMVEDALMENHHYLVAKAYITYRYEHALQRQRRNDKDVLELVSGESEYWNTENSNKNSRWVTTQRDYIAGSVSTDIARNYLFPKEVIEAHDAGLIHIHKNIVA